MARPYDTMNFELVDETGKDRFWDVQSFIECSFDAIAREGCILCINDLLRRLGLCGTAGGEHALQSVGIKVSGMGPEALLFAVWAADQYQQCLIGDKVTDSSIRSHYSEAGFQLSTLTDGTGEMPFYKWMAQDTSQ